jgi:hypothetical protein
MERATGIEPKGEALSSLENKRIGAMQSMISV